VPRPTRPTTRHLPEGLAILHEDPDILVVEKPPGLLTVGTDKGESRTVYFALTDYVRKGYAKSPKRVFVVHRLDREASGILVFAKSEQAKRSLQDQWPETTKKYLAVVHGAMAQPSGTIASYLAESAAYRVYSTPDETKGKLSRTAYVVLRETRDFSLLEVELLTGRKHQIRVHLAESGHPIVGDRKYGKRDLAHSRLALHALSIAFTHPFNGRPCRFETDVPGYFRALVGGRPIREP
jgi:tRNA pseudouridine32 synthase/23S rRNA pseudouridine746 synthase/23S rRNA pseudouridine1911/1915/1917 synthase